MLEVYNRGSLAISWAVCDDWYNTLPGTISAPYCNMNRFVGGHVITIVGYLCTAYARCEPHVYLLQVGNR